MKKIILFFSILTILVAALSGCGANTTVASWTTSGTVVNNSEDESWELSAGRVNGHIRRDATFTQDNLDFFFVRSSNTEGEVRLTLIQGDNEFEIDLTGGIDGFIATGGLEPGDIRLRLDFDGATDVNVMITWNVRLFF